MYIVFADMSLLINNDWTIYFTRISVVFDPSYSPWHCSLEVLVSHFVSFLFHSVWHMGKWACACTRTQSYTNTSSVEEVGVILPCRPSGWICLRVQLDFLICVTNTNAFKFPTALLLTSLIPCNALFTSSLASPLPHPSSLRIREGTATHDSAGRKSIWPWRLCFKWAINGIASQFYFLS